MPQNKKISCNHPQKDRYELNPSTSYCYKCSSLIIINETKNIISTIKPEKYFIFQETTPLFLSLVDDHRPHFFLNKNNYIKYRSKIIKEMKNFSNYYKLQKKTFFLAVDYLDKICSNMPLFNLDALKQISQFCLILAVKFQENGYKAVEIQKNISQKISNNFEKDEIYLLKLLNYDLSVITSYDILLDIMNCGFLFEDENISLKKMNIIYTKMEKMIYLFSESKYYIDMTPKEIALSIISLIRESFGLKTFSSERFKSVFSINDINDEKIYLNCFVKIKKCFKIKIEENITKNQTNCNGENVNISINKELPPSPNVDIITKEKKNGLVPPLQSEIINNSSVNTIF